MVTISNVKSSTIPSPEAPRSPSLAEQLRDDATRIERETDALGRVIGVKKLNFLDLNRLTRLLGEDAQNIVALNQSLYVASVVEIDGQTVSKPQNMLQLEALMQRLDFHGVAAATTALERFVSVGGHTTADEIKN